MQNVSTSVFTLKLTFIIIAKKLLNIWATFVQTFVTKKLQKLPNPVTLVVMHKLTKTWEHGQRLGTNTQTLAVEAVV